MGVDSQHNLLNTPELICVVLAKLSLHLQDRWNLNTLFSRRWHSKKPTLVDLANFIENEVTLIYNPLYSSEAVTKYFEKRPTKQSQRGDRRQFHKMANKSHNLSEGTQVENKTSNERACLKCKCNEKNHIEDCNYYFNRS